MGACPADEIGVLLIGNEPIKAGFNGAIDWPVLPRPGAEILFEAQRV